MFHKSIFIFTLFLLFVTQPAKATVTQEQKIGQMLMLGFQGTQLNPDDPIVKDILAQRIGGVVLYARDDHTKGIRNIANPQQLKLLTQQLQAYALQAAKAHHNNLYPLLIAVDYEGGKVVNLKEENGFPKTFSAAEVGKSSYSEAKNRAEQMAQTLSTEGINLDFAPVIDVNINPDNPIIGKYCRSFSADPNKVATYADIFSKEFHKQNILCAYKHFPGHGSSTTDSHLGFVDVTKTWKPSELIPYKKLFKNPTSCNLVMTAHVVNRQLDKSGYPATLSHPIMTDLLRKKLKFKGVVITDDLQMKAISKHYDTELTTKLALNAGADILLFSNQLVEIPQDTAGLVRIISRAVENGEVSENRINESYKRVMDLKKNL